MDISNVQKIKRENFLWQSWSRKVGNARENTTVTYTATGKEDGVTLFSMSPVDLN